MKVIIKILSGLIILTVLGISGLFGYSKFKETEDLKKQLTEQKTDQANAGTISDDQNNENQAVSSNTNISTSNNEVNHNTSNTKVNRNNVFDYVIKAINDSGGDASLITFQEPTYNSSTDTWNIVANNKSGAGATYKIFVDSSGHVIMTEGIDDDVVIDEDISLN
ncbi:hypothetical protein MT340_000255 [Staphylococcus sp. NRL 16/872]|uniref:hypothetical protein n=1 Tax=Staphylococcus sp. NRL 16/872 TaxID=2930131 RepID=UPI001FB54474|nr:MULTISPECIES: hypothetical protein [unclassified Staphylococcus]MCJ1655215.1 hypothetical protein [Staphylococcus sp. NRL 21/187]MCJ1661049.1 hypothetical protein [Staphylococcus sp. NRL 18/288]MCJ1666947.1 hypothetical protein [Staphylococcus sp. NRL 19/737]WEN69419.1 hypothetical protein MT340_000255 [Staphylococcus sp. NRL 16/872]